MNRLTREISAHHEAGHAVVALAFGVPVRRASIKSRGSSYGRVIVPDLPNVCNRVQLFILFAGPFAHKRFAPTSDWLTDDLVIAQKMIFGTSGTEATKEKRLAHVVDYAEQIVDYLWADIKVVAKALLKYETLTGDEIAAAIRAARRKSGRRRRTGDPPAFTSSKAQAITNAR
jgi:hypothetical protein